MENIRVLIVDDLPHVRQGLASVLQLAGKKARMRIELVGEARNGSEAIEKASSLLPDVILMDLEMPNVDGYEATRRIKAEQPSIRVIILSIHSGIKEQELALSAGADNFISKDCSIEVLVNAILTTKISNCP